MKFDFLISSERSGSNLLTKLLDSHSQYCAPSPPHLLRVFIQNFSKYQPLESKKNSENLVLDIVEFFNSKIGVWNTFFSIEELLSVHPFNLASLVKYIYEKEASFHKKNKVFIKEVQTYRFFDFLNSNFSDAKFIWLVRDPRDMALSWSKSPVHRGDIVRAAKIWKEDQHATLKLYNQYPEKVFLVRYEELITDQINTLKKICNFLNIDFEINMTDFHSKDLTGQNSLQTDSWKNLNKKIISENSKKYLVNLNRKQVQYIEYLCLNEMRVLEYKTEYDIISQTEFNQLESQLIKEERNEKEEYLNISETEKIKRQKWVEKLHQIQKR